MHSSGMRTARLLTVSQHALCVWGGIPACTGRGCVCIPACTGQGRVCIPACTGQGCLPRGRGCLPRGVSAPLHAGIHTPSLGRHPPPRGQTYTCEKHNLRKLRLRAVIRESVKGTDSCTSRSLFLFRTSVNGSA